jgi:lipopolysaccharide/colanic/teichoic acid biosynthesis glycosyltransferase
MDLVGPRPEVPRYVALYDEEQRGVLSVRPGITDPASVEFRSESDLMAGHPDPERLYVDEIMPRKLAINLEYLRTRSLASDIGVIFSTIAALARPRG